ncbi:MAG: ATP-binding cassette domain-containing protein [Lachnospiraceae bacterium]|nr:ATP-binding cassette domain-containing protein [Lachnospiraceae bacterium]
MLQVQHICKEYRTGSLVQKALDDVSLNLRDNEFVAILGPSGSGKTTLLNIIGGLDQYDSGDLIINGISTKHYRDRDWDSYRNHTIGFVFQSYNLIPHQTLLSNVELALTISGVGKAERRRRAKKALEEVGLGEQAGKKPNQLSGGQMQRVAIARALVNNPDILLADEPTGALDSDTSVQVMDLLKEVARDRLVVMVTHNPELAREYATRIVELRDGKIRSDTNPYTADEAALGTPVHKNMGKSSMSLRTAVALSFNNLRTKKARTILTSFAGSIGIIGIALILALSTGVNEYIADVEEETLTGYPLEITNSGFDMTSLFAGMMTSSGGSDSGDSDEEEDSQTINVVQMITSMFSSTETNDLAALKEYLDSGESGIEPYVNAIEYTYDVVPQIFRQEDDGVRQVNPDSSFSSLGFGSGSSSSSLISSMMSTDVFYQLPETEKLYAEQYEVKAGRWPENYNELVLVLYSDGSMSDFLLYTLGLRDSVELEEMVRQFVDGENVEAPENTDVYSYDDVLGTTFKLVSAADYYEYDEQYEVWTDRSGNADYMEELVADGEDLTIVGIVQAKEGSDSTVLSSGIYYSSALSRHVAEKAAESEIVQSQLDNPDINVFTGEVFGADDSESEFDLSSLVTVDEDAIAGAFDFDTSAMEEAFAGAFDVTDAFDIDLGSLNLSDLVDLGSISITIPDMPAIDLAELLGDIQIDVSAVDLDALADSLLTGFEEYAAEETGLDYANLGQYFEEYLLTDEAQQLLTERMLEVFADGSNVTVDTEQIYSLGEQLIPGYLEYISQKEGSSLNDYLQGLQEYLAEETTQTLLQDWVNENVQIDYDVTVSPEQLEALLSELFAGYEAYAEEMEYPDAQSLGELFLGYLGTDTASALLTEALAEMVDMEALEQQISASMQDYMEEMFASYGEALASSLESQISAAMSQVMSQVMEQLSSQMESAMADMVSEMAGSLEDSFGIDAEAFMEAFAFNMDSDMLTELLVSMSTSADATYESNLETLGYVDFTNPSEIAIYPTDFESKESVIDILDAYNERMETEGKEEQVISYTDTVGTLMSSVTDIIDIISYVLIAFVAISLVVSSIMIGVITYISVLERKKEIGILRAIGASKRNISEVFNAETGIIGLCAGLLGIGLALLLTIPGNALIRHYAGSAEVSMVLFPQYAAALIFLSVCLTLIGGLIPSSKASRSDPVTALRTE